MYIDVRTHTRTHIHARTQITFTDYGTVEEVAVTQIREGAGGGPAGGKKNLKAEDAKKRKEKLEKKKQKMKEVEEQRESEKKKWQVWVGMCAFVSTVSEGFVMRLVPVCL